MCLEPTAGIGNKKVEAIALGIRLGLQFKILAVLKNHPCTGPCTKTSSDD